jgi:TolA-binding protein
MSSLRGVMNSKEKIVIFAALLITFYSCSAPQIDEDFLNDEYYFNSKPAVVQTNGSYKLQNKVDSLILELNRVQFRLFQMQLDYLTLSNNMLNLQLHASELKLMQHIKEHELTALRESEPVSDSPVENISKAKSGKQNNSEEKRSGENNETNQAPDNRISEEKNAEELASANIDKHKVLVFDNIYEKGILLFNKRKYKDAQEKFDSVLNLDVKDEDLVDNAYYWLGESYFALGNYVSAIENFKKVIEINNSNKNADALVMLGQTYEKLGWKELAKETYSKFIKQHPKNKNIPLAKARLKNL